MQYATQSANVGLQKPTLVVMNTALPENTTQTARMKRESRDTGEQTE